MTQTATPQSFEDGLLELETLVRKLEEGRLPLDEAITAFERGSTLRKFCEEKLMNAKLKIDQILVDSAGDVRVEPSQISANAS